MYNVMWWVLIVVVGLSQLLRLAELMGTEIKRDKVSDWEPETRFFVLLLSLPFWYYTWVIFLNARVK